MMDVSLCRVFFCKHSILRNLWDKYFGRAPVKTSIFYNLLNAGTVNGHWSVSIEGLIIQYLCI